MARLFLQELLNVWRVFRAAVALRFYGQILLNLPAILRERKFYAADRGMAGALEYRLLGRWVPADLDKLSTGALFSFLREFAGRNVYFRAFAAERLTFDVCFDAGANAGIVSEALSALGDHRNRVFAIEALFYDVPNWPPLLARRANITLIRKALLDGRAESAAYLQAMAGEAAPQIAMATMRELIGTYGIERISFFKIDIEGGEYPLLQNDNDWLERVDNIAMEVHRDEGDAAALVESLRRAGFDVVCTDDFGTPTEPHDTAYLYASRTGALNASYRILPALAG